MIMIRHHFVSTIKYDITSNRLFYVLSMFYDHSYHGIEEYFVLRKELQRNSTLYFPNNFWEIRYRLLKIISLPDIDYAVLHFQTASTNAAVH